MKRATKGSMDIRRETLCLRAELAQRRDLLVLAAVILRRHLYVAIVVRLRSCSVYMILFTGLM